MERKAGISWSDLFHLSTLQVMPESESLRSFVENGLCNGKGILRLVDSHARGSCVCLEIGFCEGVESLYKLPKGVGVDQHTSTVLPGLGLDVQSTSEIGYGNEESYLLCVSAKNRSRLAAGVNGLARLAAKDTAQYYELTGSDKPDKLQNGIPLLPATLKLVLEAVEKVSLAYIVLTGGQVCMAVWELEEFHGPIRLLTIFILHGFSTDECLASIEEAFQSYALSLSRKAFEWEVCGLTAAANV